MTSRTVSELADLCGATLEGDGERQVVGPASLAEAQPDQVSFFGNELYAKQLADTRAGAVIVSHKLEVARDDISLLRCDDPSRAFSRVIETFQPPRPLPEPGIHPAAVVAEDARIGAEASIGACCVIGSGAVIEEGAVLHPNVTIGPGARVGAETVLHPGVVLYADVQVGKRCLLHSGVVLGADGFGFNPSREGWEKIPQLGTVIVEDDVEIGANTTVDRARFGATRLCKGVKIDNLVQVAHNVYVGPNAMLVAQVGISGSATIRDWAILAGQVGVAGHVEVGPGARVAAQSGVARSVPGGKDYMGTPTMGHKDYLRVAAAQRRVPEVLKRHRELEERVRKLEEES